MDKENTRIWDILNKGRYNEANIIKVITKCPSYIFFYTIIFIILIKITEYYAQNYLAQLLPFYKFIVDVAIDSIIGISMIITAVYCVKKNIKASEKNMKTEEQYGFLVNNLKEVIFQTDSEGLWTFLNPAWTEITGYSIYESIGRNFIEFVYPEDREKNIVLFKPLIERKKEYCRYEIRYLSKTNGYCWVEIFARLTFDGRGNILGTSGTIKDITKRKAMEQELINREKLLQGVSEATTILLNTMELEEAFNSILEVLGNAIMTDRAYIFQNHFHPITKKIAVSQKSEWCNKDIKPQIDNPDLQDICYEEFGIMRWYDTLSSGNPIHGWVCDFPTQEREILEPQGVITLALVPIFVDNTFWGFLGFDDCSQNKDWTKSEIALLYTAATSIGGAIKRVEDEKQIQRLLKNDLKQTVENLQNLVFKCRKNHKNEIYFTLFEGKLAKKIGLNTDIVFEKKLSEVFPGKTVYSIMDHFKEAFKGQICNFEIMYKGSTYYTSLSPIINDHEVTEVVGSAIDITDLKTAEEQIHYMAYYDTLTGLPNRAFFREQLSYLTAHAHGNKKMMGIMFLDLDRFKLINDTLGHVVGDELLKQTAIRLKNVVRENDMVIRMGGDEFIIVFPEISEDGNISKMAEKIIDVFRNSFNIDGEEICVSTSIGVSVYPSDGEDMDTLIKNADAAMYHAKKEGRNNYQRYTENMDRKGLSSFEMDNSLQRALNKEELCYIYNKH